MQGPRDRFHRLRLRLQADEVRIPIQTAAAVLIAYFAAGMLVPENISWGVFSALFVVQASIGGTIGAALGRVAGAALGALIAVGLVMLLGDQGWGTLVALLLGVGLMSFLSAKWPILAYGLVTVTIIVVAPDLSVVEGALHKVIAIAVGSICGMIAAFAVLPVRARLNEQQYLAQALRSCGDYLLECTACLLLEKPDKDKSSQDAIHRALERARVMAQEARIEEKTPAMGLSRFSPTLLLEIERFAYTLTLVDRFSDRPMAETVCQDNKEALMTLATAVKVGAEKIADAIEAGEACGELDEATEIYDDFARCVDESMARSDLPLEDKEHMVAVKRAYGSVLGNLEELARHARGC